MSLGQAWTTAERLERGWKRGQTRKTLERSASLSQTESESVKSSSLGTRHSSRASKDGERRFCTISVFCFPFYH